MTEREDPDSHLGLDRVRMTFGRRVVFESLTCSFPRGEISVILGGSGSGKSTILRLIGGLVAPDAGRILVEGEDVASASRKTLAGIRDKIGMLFQGGALLDSITVFDNLALPLREHNDMSEPQIAEAVHDRLGSVGLHDVDDLLPNQLSGGMRKRVALARAIILNPMILLCDEPFSGLDPISTRRTEALLMEINQRRQMTIVVVSHHVPSTMRMAARVAVLLPDGVAIGTPEEMLASSDPRVQAFFHADEGDIGEAVGEIEIAPGGTP